MHPFVVSQVYKLPEPDPAVLAEYMNAADGAPQSLIEAAVCARNEEDATALCKAFVGDREGYANVGQFPSAEGVHVMLSVTYMRWHIEKFREL